MAALTNPNTVSFMIPDHIKGLYEGPGRHYHNLTHITHMLSLIPAQHPHIRELTYATWFHDCVYDPQAKHGANETESIRLWEAYVAEQGDKLTDVGSYNRPPSLLLIKVNPT